MSIKVMTRGGKVLLKKGKAAITKDDGLICGPCCSGGCPDPNPATITVTFSGMNICTGCVSVAAGTHVKFSTLGAANSAFILPFISANYWKLTGIGPFSFLNYDVDETCSGTSVGNSASGTIYAQCNSGFWDIFFRIESGINSMAFFALSTSISGLIVPNSVVCNQLFADVFPDTSLFNATAVAIDGIATISF